MLLTVFIAAALLFIDSSCQKVVTNYNGQISGNRTITECITGGRNPYAKLEITTSEMIISEGYSAEDHFIVTEDGYLLTLNRIPGPPDSPPVLLQHGAYSCSFDYIVIGKEKALAFLLADMGYDVWLSNSRGTQYSRCHVSLTNNQDEYWDFTLEDLSVKDISAQQRYIRSINDEDLFYVGHSLGTTMSYVLASQRPEVFDKIRAVFHFGPVVYFYRIRGLLKLFIPYLHYFAAVVRFLTHGEFASQNQPYKFLYKLGCYLLPTEGLCREGLFLTMGPDHAQFNKSLLPLILNHSPAGGSINILENGQQYYKNRKFEAFDYGTERNLREYNSSTPPEYDLSKHNKPTYLFWSEGDFLADTEDVEQLRRELPNVALNYRIPYPKFNHIDFIWANDVRELLYNKVVSEMEKLR